MRDLIRAREAAVGDLVAAMTTVIGGLLLRDTKDVDIKVGSGVEAAQRA
jgi:hypothetical protein